MKNIFIFNHQKDVFNSDLLKDFTSKLLNYLKEYKSDKDDVI